MDVFVYNNLLNTVTLPHSQQNMPLVFKFQQDNDLKHSSKLVSVLFRDNNFNGIKCPSQSPDLNNTENLQDEMKKLCFKCKNQNYGEIFQNHGAISR